jgi:arylsulfatase A-like enzyme
MSLSEDLADDMPLWSDTLLENDYSLHFTGKWHVSKNKDPKDFGWQEGVC